MVFWRLRVEPLETPPIDGERSWQDQGEGELGS